MAHTLDTSTETNTQTGQPVTYNYTCGAGTTAIVLSIVTGGTTDRAGGAPTIDGVAMTQADQVRKYATTPEQGTEIWYYADERLRVGLTVAVSIPNTVSAKTLHMVTCSCKAAAGYKTVYDNAAGNTGATANPSVGLTCADGAFVVNRIGHGNTAPTNFSSQTGTLLQNQDHGAYCSEARYTIKSGAGTFTFSSTMTADDWGMCIVSLKEAVHTHPVTKITQFRGGILSGRRYGSFASKPAAGGMQYATPADSLSLTEAAAKQVGKTLAETIALTEAAIRQARKPLADSLGMSENLLTSVVKLTSLGDSLSLSENVALMTSRTVQEAVSLTEAAARSAGKSLTEVLDLSEAATKQATRTVADTLGLSESTLAGAIKLWSGGDNISLTDYLVYRTTKVVQETLTLSEAQARSVQKSLADSLAASETLVRSAQRAIAETVTLSESLAFALAKQIASDTLSLTDQVTGEQQVPGGRTIGRITQLHPGTRSGRRYSSFTGRAGAGSYSQAAADTVSLTELLTSLAVKTQAVSDTLSLHEALDLLQIQNINDPDLVLTEALQKRAGTLVGDAISLMETASQRAGKTLADTLGTAEALQRDAKKVVADSLGLTEQVVATRITDVILQGTDDALSLAEALSLQTGKALVETVGIVETVQRTTGRTIAELADLTESAVRQALHPIAETLDLQEQLILEVLNLTSSITTGDTLSLTESLGRSIQRAVEESLGLTEALGSDVRAALAEALGFTEALRLSLTRGVAEALGLTEQLQAALATMGAVCAWTAKPKVYALTARHRAWIFTARTVRT